MRHDDRVVSGYAPIEHAVHTAEPDGATAPLGQLTHVAADVARTTLLAVPTGQSVQKEEPSESL